MGRHGFRNTGSVAYGMQTASFNWHARSISNNLNEEANTDSECTVNVHNSTSHNMHTSTVA